TTTQTNRILYEKKQIRICSLSTKRNDTRMWGYYADSHKGVNLCITVAGRYCEVLKVAYGPKLEINAYNERATAKEILLHKYDDWE
ncbi:hypothetical protein OFC38_33365, partial [Escherichia coli]|nr:hypothetical protein [Escherichia coli]